MTAEFNFVVKKHNNIRPAQINPGPNALDFMFLVLEGLIEKFLATWKKSGWQNLEAALGLLVDPANQRVLRLEDLTLGTRTWYAVQLNEAGVMEMDARGLHT